VDNGVTGKGSVQIHGFAKASARAYGCAVVIKNDVSVRLITAKSRVAPLKTLTNPRTELFAAHLFAMLWHTVRDDLDFIVESIFLWSDSEVVLHWLLRKFFLQAEWRTYRKWPRVGFDDMWQSKKIQTTSCPVAVLLLN